MSLNARKLFFAVLLATAMVFLVIPSAFAYPPTTVYVDDGFDSSTPGWGVDHFAKIQDGINAVAEGGTVNVLPGTYQEQILIQKSLNLIGAGSGVTFVKAPDTSTMSVSGITGVGNNWISDFILAAYPTDWNGASATGTSITVKVSGFTFDANNKIHQWDRYSGVFFGCVRGTNYGDAGLFDSVITGFNTDDSSATGVRILGDSKLSVSNCTIGYTINGIAAYGDLYTAPDPDVLMENNTLNCLLTALSGDEYALNVCYGATGTVSHNTVTDTSVIGVLVSNSNGVTVSDNTISNQGDGIRLYIANNNIISGNTISNCSCNGIRLDGSSYNTILQNNISDVHSGDTSSLGDCGWGIGIENYSGTSTNNTIGDATAANANTITNCDAGIAFYGVDATNKANGNKIYGNSPYNLGNSNTSVTIDARYNWWGTAVLPTIQSKISGNVNFEPYYVDSAMTTLNTPPPTTVYVDVNYSDGNADGHTFGYDAFNKIQDGINAVSTGGTVNVAAGTYNEPQIIIDKPLTLQGAGIGQSIIDGGDAALTNEGLIRIVAPGNVTVDGFTIQNAGGPSVNDYGDGKLNVGVYAQSNSNDVTYTISNVKILGRNTPEDKEDYGLYSHGGKETLIFTHSIITQTSGNAILMERHIGPTEISYNTLDAGCYGVDPIFYMTYGDVDITTLQKISNNTIDVSTGNATDRVTAISFTGAFNGNLGNGKYTNISIEGNQITGLSQNRRGISLYNDASGDGTGGEIAGAIIRNNTITATSSPSSNCFGIRLAGYITNTNITHNVISGTNIGVLVTTAENSGSVVPVGTIVNYNSISNNVAYGIQWDGTTLLDATKNWWGTAVLSTIQSKISGNVNFVPYYVDSAMTTLNTTPPTTVYVDDNYSDGNADGHIFGYDAFNKIQDGINAVAEGGTVNVYPGTYQEQVIINKSLTLSGSGTPTIIAPGTLQSFKFPEATNIWEPVVLAYGGTADGSGNVTGTGTVNVSITGFVVDGNNRVPTSNYYSAGILLRNVQVDQTITSTISQNEVKNMYIGNPLTFGIFVLGNSNVEISGNSINGYSKGGIVVNGDSTTSPLNYPAPNAIIQNNIVTGPGTNSPNAPNGIQIGKGATGKILNNTVTNNGYGTYGTTACGILVSGSTGVEISGNNVYQNKTGICAYSYSDSSNSLLAVNTWIHHNTINNNKYGITVQNRCQNTTIEYNTIQSSLVEGIALEWYGSETNVPQNTIIRYNTISNNNTSNNDDGAGIWIDSNMGSVQIYGNNFINNRNYGLLSYTPSISAEYNWWGDIYGPNHSDKVSGNVDYDPWLGQQVNPDSPPTLPNNKIEITTTSCPTGALGLEYSQTLSCQGASGTVTWYVSNTSTLPLGLSLNPATGQISGIPAQYGTFQVEFMVRDSVQATSKILTIKIEQYALEITNVRILDLTGTPTNTFPPSGFYQVEVTIKNNTDFAIPTGMVLIQSKYIDTPIHIGTLSFQNLAVGETKLVGTIGFNLPSGNSGTWNVQVFGWSKWASQGGTSWALVKPASFTVSP